MVNVFLEESYAYFGYSTEISYEIFLFLVLYFCFIYIAKENLLFLFSPQNKEKKQGTLYIFTLSNIEMYIKNNGNKLFKIQLLEWNELQIVA